MRFVHTADWQIGKPFLQIKDEQKRFKLRQERLNVIGRIKEVAKAEKAQFILIAGDLFDSPTPSASLVTEVLELIGAMEIPVLVIPGNHDYGALGTVWHSSNFQKYHTKMAPNLLLLLDKQPTEIDQAIIFPCPLLRNKENFDPTLWLRTYDWSTLSLNKPRIVLAHGGVHEFGGRDYNLDNEAEIATSNVINLGALPLSDIDYIALGDWHNLKKINNKAWYSGTPEADRFDQGENNQRSQVLLVDSLRGEEPKVTPIPTGGIRWHNIKFRFNGDIDIERFERLIDDLTLGRISRDLVRVEISGSLSLSGHDRYESLKVDIENKLLRLRIKGECNQIPANGDFENLTRSVQNPLISHVASSLQERLSIEESENFEQASITRLAISELYRFAIKD